MQIETKRTALKINSKCLKIKTNERKYSRNLAALSVQRTPRSRNVVTKGKNKQIEEFSKIKEKSQDKLASWQLAKGNAPNGNKLAKWENQRERKSAIGAWAKRFDLIWITLSRSHLFSDGPLGPVETIRGMQFLFC